MAGKFPVKVEDIDLLLKHPTCLNDWDKKFLESLKKWPLLSPKQYKYFKIIDKKVHVSLEANRRKTEKEIRRSNKI